MIDKVLTLTLSLSIIPLSQASWFNVSAAAEDCTSELSCSGRCGEGVSGLWCQCAPSCLQFGDCCWDYESCSAPNATTNATESPTITTVDSPRGAYDHVGCQQNILFVHTCPESADNDTRAACEDVNPSLQFDHAIPVTHSHTGVTYGNAFCAVCNSIDLETVRMWDTTYHCPLSPEDTADLPSDQFDQSFPRALRLWLTQLSTQCIMTFSPPSDAVTRRCVSRDDVTEVQNPVQDSHGVLHKNPPEQTGHDMVPVCYFHHGITFELQLNESLSISNSTDHTVVSVQFNQGESLHIRSEEFGNHNFEYQVCDVFSLKSLCFAISRIPDCTQKLATELFFTYDMNIRREPSGCLWQRTSERIIIITVYALGRALSVIAFTALLILRKIAVTPKSSNFVTNSMIVLIFLWIESILHCFRFVGGCAMFAPIFHFINDSVFLWLFVAGFDLHLERRDLMPPFLYMMTSWVYPLVVAVVAGSMHYFHVGLYNLYEDSAVCWNANLYWEIPQSSVPMLANLYCFAITLVKFTGNMECSPHHVKYVVLFPLLFIDWVLPLVAGYVDSEVFFMVAMFTEAYMGVLFAAVFYVMSINDKDADERFT